ncbi:hypothetical protein DL98DRAFT_294911 [Cadophora sp. DSE1049]|nr:hypothetical protein DL98DRAFT_294911 [Cadophora sp. DSE1049]
MDATRRSFKTRNLEIEDTSEARNSVPFAELFQILELRRGSGVSDARDMIFAHLGLSSDITRSMIPVDYNKSIEQLYEEIARKHIEAHKNASIIYHVETVDPSSRRKSLPSWVPDWEVAGPTKANKVGLKQVSEFRFEDTGLYFHTKPREGCIGCLKPIPGVLGLVGWDLGPITSIIPASSVPILSSLEGLDRSSVTG